MEKKPSAKEWRSVADAAVDCLIRIREGDDDSVWREVNEVIEDHESLWQDFVNSNEEQK